MVFLRASNFRDRIHKNISDLCTTIHFNFLKFVCILNKYLRKPTSISGLETVVANIFDSNLGACFLFNEKPSIFCFAGLEVFKVIHTINIFLSLCFVIYFSFNYFTNFAIPIHISSFAYRLSVCFEMSLLDILA